MDLLQRAVFGMMLHGLVEPEEIAGRLQLHPDLVRIIQKYLRDRSMVGEHGIVKADAERRYRSARFQLDEQPDRFVTGYVFQDPFSGLLLPRLVQALEIPEVTVADGGFPQLRLGERLVRPFVEFPPPTPPATPSPADVLGAAEAFARAQRRVRTDVAPDDDEQPGRSPRFLQRMQRVNFIEERPELMFLSTFVFGDGPGAWEVADPFGLPTSPLTALAHQRIRHSKGLAQLVERLGAVAAEKPAPARDPVEGALAALEQRFGFGLERHPLLQPLIEAELGHQEFLGAPVAQQSRKARASLQGTRLLLENLFRELRARFSTAQVERQLVDGDRDHNLRRLEHAAAALGFETPLPSTLTSVKVGDVFWMANRDQSGKLRPLLAALLLSARDHSAHPLRAAAAEEPCLLQRLDEALGWCGEAAHAGTPSVAVEERASPALEVAYLAVRHLCPPTPSREDVHATSPSTPAAAQTLRVAPEPLHIGFDDLEA
ncbi:hypothetical protein [Deinococcus sp. AJ005]|uniref:hypothetical protein n=1 Tax=Deinococcus sp. AJ005 TaxID=2652443 RepID=UPI00125CB833|nr:hypothetical protein [Deinococcus sp. AJ005]QFP75010.1 hypothetical protein DAAJ005_00140 [Deinococcus sp. AJ005]